MNFNNADLGRVDFDALINSLGAVRAQLEWATRIVGTYALIP